MGSILTIELGRQFRRLMGRILLRPEKKKPEKFQEWSIGIYGGSSPTSLTPLQNAINPVLTHEDVSDVRAAFVADPFMLHVDHAWYMFFEVMNKVTGKGEIGLAVSEDGRRWSYEQIVLREPFHLSYPYVFEWERQIYMIPETHRAKSVRLYKAVAFPKRWELVGTLLRGEHPSDASVFFLKNMWWLFLELAGPPLFAGHLRLFYADRLMGPWLEHPKSPIVAGDPRIARPAGRVLTFPDRAIRYTQDCYPDYGTCVRGFEITDLTPISYAEQEIAGGPILSGTGVGWNRCGMHHVDPHLMDDGRWIACVDGWGWRAR